MLGFVAPESELAVLPSAVVMDAVGFDDLLPAVLHHLVAAVEIEAAAVGPVAFESASASADPATELQPS
jgi:hypothetical protein